MVKIILPPGGLTSKPKKPQAPKVITQPAKAWLPPRLARSTQTFEPEPADTPKPERPALLLYVHVPFCRSKCRYCAFHSVPLTMDSMEDMERYAEAVAREMKLWGQRLGKPPAHTVYFGGGTPSVLPEYALERIMRALRDSFDLSGCQEFTFEANPDSVHLNYLRELRDFGVNRLSLGVQSLNNDELAFLGRPHNAMQAVQAFQTARAAGFGNVSLDFIWGLPRQNAASWIKTLKKAEELRPEHLSCYGLTIEPNTPLEVEEQAGTLILPGEDMLAKCYIYGAQFLEEHGYLQYEISSFARMGYASKHNMGYWAGSDYLGFGPAATSTFGGRRWTNPTDLHDYVFQVDAGGTGKRAEELDEATRLRERIMLALRTTQGLDLREHDKRTGGSFLERHRKLVTLLRNNGLIRLSKGCLSLTRTGMLVSDTIIEKLAFSDEEPTSNGPAPSPSRQAPQGAGPTGGPHC
ncbi:putative oxygen-independent coproporphyrinogen III oxidase [Desulfocurvibacter africanus PCS]|uniref:Heme chaperone HemW n=1 Tax=Desulfocurvibacter africanus PCS TaxID=1262666 RepID=M5Q1C9_DESAF|nr:radical SAM family heme chaperone HemW [Desulfocurvibacter africanus]EMG36443.1 putative oxygen-independent coproporphyrinogen III oxidase [Desulfocurvibacter africanus PCS]